MGSVALRGLTAGEVAVRVRNAADARAVGLLRERQLAVLRASTLAAAVGVLDLSGLRRAGRTKVNELSVDVDTSHLAEISDKCLDDVAATVTLVAVFDAHKSAASVGTEFTWIATVLVTVSVGIAALVNVAANLATAARTGIGVGRIIANAVGVR